MSQFLDVFFEESFEGLEVMESGLLDMDPGTVDDETINTIFRAAHSIKGGSGTFGLMQVADFTHVMETLLDEMRDGKREVTHEAVDLLLQSVDCLREMLSANRNDDDVDEERVQGLQNALQEMLDNGGDTAASPQANLLGVDESSALASAGEQGWQIKFAPHTHLFSTGNDPVRIFRELSLLGKLEATPNTTKLPEINAFHVDDCFLSWDLTLTGGVDLSDIQEVFEWVEDDCDLEISPLAQAVNTLENAAEAVSNEVVGVPSEPQAETVKKPAAKPKSKSKSPKSKESSTSIRVGTDKVDKLIDLVGELVITQSMLGQIGEDFHIGRLEQLRDGLAQFERNTRELQESVMRIRMMPISFAFNRFPRMVHDVSQKLGKKVELKMMGESTEVDKTVMEKIGDPLVHLVRNSIDHGIEMPDARVEKGKPAEGTVLLNAFHRGGSIVIEIIDDGAGIDRERVLEKAISKGLVDENDGEKMSDTDVFNLLFEPGFSTAESVSDLSGRGVGMDVVRSNVRELGGSVDVISELGAGSTFTIRLPLTLAIVDGQTIQVGNETYIVPLVSIVESIQVSSDMINMVAGRGETLKLRDEYLPIIRLHELFGADDDSGRDLTEGLLVIVDYPGGRRALFVDELLGQQQVVIKSLEQNYQKVEGISGATILGDGSVALILDIPGIVRLAGARQSAANLKLTA